jgi:hypothetical protein
MLIDTKPLCHAGSFTILQERHEVLFMDDTTVGLHLVTQRGAPNVYLRALVHSGINAMVFDVRDVASSLGEELPITPTRDLRGLVSLTLRHRYTTATEFAAAVMSVTLACALLGDDAPPTPRHATHPAPPRLGHFGALTDARAYA